MENYRDDSENLLLETRTEPRNLKRNITISKSNRIPLKGLSKDNNGLSSDLKLLTEKNSISEPVNQTKVRSRIIQNKAKVVEEKVENEFMESKLNVLKPEKIDAASLAKILDHDTFIEDELGHYESNERKLFGFLENEGRLSPGILKVFCKSSHIRTVNMTNSYAGIKNESGQISSAKYSEKLCTKPFYFGFQQLLKIDLTNVKICDDELRYLIRLPKLQALGLSGTLITDKGIKYVSVHSKFKLTLKCLKLCYIDGISDAAIKYLNNFLNLQNLDLRGNKNISLCGCLDLVTDTSNRPNSCIYIRFPQNIQEELSHFHNYYKELSKSDSDIIIDPHDFRISKLSRSEIKSQLKLHVRNYSDIYLNQETEFLQKKLVEIIIRRKKEEYLYRYSMDK